MKWAQWVMVMVAALLAGGFISLPTWAAARADLLVFLGIFAAALIQTAVTTANLTLPDHLSVDEARRLSANLERQQRYWVGLFGAIVVAALLIIATGPLGDKSFKQALPWVGEVNFAPAASALLGAVAAFILAHSIVFVSGLLSIQRLRSRFVVQAAERRAAAAAEHVMRSGADKPFKPPEGYGEILPPPH